ncbi:MAG: (Fe-S)-binding protein, partial [Paracoccaceae bacterium]
VDDFETHLDWSSWPGNAQGFQGAVEMCNNNGACRKLKGGVMCPSFRATRDEKDSTRGRANTLRLAISGQLGQNALTSDAMAETLALCVSCKACKRECPTGVDMAAMKIEMTALRTKEKGLSFQDRLISYLPDYAPFAARFASVANLRDKIPGLARLSSYVTGFTAKRPLPRWRRDWFRDTEIDQMPSGTKPVILFIDTFNRYFEPDNVRSALRVLEHAGYSVFAPMPETSSSRALCCGKTHLATGNIEKARQSATRLVETYAPFAQAGIPIVGLEPSCLFALKDEVAALLKTEAARSVAQSAMTFEELLSKDAAHLRLKPLKAKALLHGHCHQKAYGVMGPVETVLNMIEGLEVSTIETSCCGMAGAFGYGRDTYEVSQKMAEADLLPAVRNATGQTILIADGTSCRSQIKDGAARNAIHVARFLDQQLQDP